MDPQLSPPSQVELGEKYRDKLHGFIGVAVAQTIYLYSCTRVCLETAKEDGSNELWSQWFDIMQIEPLNKEAENNDSPKEEAAPTLRRTGGPGATPPSRDSSR